MTITLDASQFVIDLLTANGIRFVLEDKDKAIREEQAYGTKLRKGSPKFVAHLKRLELLEAQARPEQPEQRNTQPQANAVGLSECQQDAVKVLMSLNGLPQPAAEKAVRNVQGGSAEEIVKLCISRAI